MGVVKDYFSFSKRERTGAVVLVTLIVLIFVLPEFIPSKKISGLEALADFPKAADGRTKDSIDLSDHVSRQESFSGQGENLNQNSGRTHHGRLDYFDPNTLSENGWIKMGISERTAATIKKFVSKGGSFKKPEDIGKIYGLSRAQYERLLPYVRISPPVMKEEPEWKDLSSHDNRKIYSRQLQNVVDINTADTGMLIKLPGIGSKLANRIISFRNKLGGFYAIEQIKEVYGLPDSTYVVIRPLLTISSGIQKININTATAEQFQSHPYLRWNVGNAIINYRLQHGSFANLEDLLQIDIITPEMIERLKPYLELN